jgi:predicted ATP-grasp superfamily ATP-dependent carboligase
VTYIKSGGRLSYASVRSCFPQYINHVFISHFHADHTHGLRVLQALGIEDPPVTNFIGEIPTLYMSDRAVALLDHVVRERPAATPLAAVPRPGVDVTVLVNELFVPVGAADAFADAMHAWMGSAGVEEIAVLSGVPVAHGPDDHRAFYVATDDYRGCRLADVDVRPMGNGFLDGVNASLMARGLDADAGVFITPVHARVPDVEAAIRLVDAVNGVYDLDLDTGDLEAFAAEVERHYAELSERLEATREEARPEERMYM